MPRPARSILRLCPLGWLTLAPGAVREVRAADGTRLALIGAFARNRRGVMVRSLPMVGRGRGCC